MGGGKVGPQTLDESTWLITVVEGADCIRDTLNGEEQQKVKDGLLCPATDVIRQHKLAIHNIQCWKNSAVGTDGFAAGRHQPRGRSAHGPSGYHNQMAQGRIRGRAVVRGRVGLPLLHIKRGGCIWQRGHITAG